MIEISHDANSFHFSNLTAAGIELIDNFDRKHPLMAIASLGIPAIRSFKWSTLEEFEMLKDLEKCVIQAEK